MSEVIDRDDAPPTHGPNVFAVLWRRKSLVLLGLTIGLVLGGLYYLQQAPKFQSTAQLYVMKRRAEALPATTPGTDSRVAFVEDYVATQEALMKSREIIDRAAKKLEAGGGLADRPIGSDYVGYISNGLTVNRLKDSGTGGTSNVLHISFRGPKQDDCARVVNAVIEGYRDSLTGAVSNVTEDNLNQIVRGIEDTEKKLNAAEGQYETAHEKSRETSHLSAADLKSRVNVNETKRAELVLRNIEVLSRLQLIEQGIKAGQDRGTLLALYVLSDPEKRDHSVGQSVTLQETLLTLRLKEEELLQTLGPDHPDVQSVRRRAALVRQYVQAPPEGMPAKGDPLDLYVQVLKKDLEANEKQQKQLAGILDADRAASRKLDEALVEEALHKDRVDRLRKQLDNYSERKQQIDLTRDTPLFEARVITPPGQGERVSPVLYQNLALGAFLGLLLGGGLAFVAEITDRSFRSIAEVRKRLGVSIIGQVPSIKPTEQVAPLDPMLITRHRPKSAEAEAFRGIRTTLYFSTRGKGHQVIQITSPTAAEGKSTVASNLAVSIAQSGKRVILIDADFRKPRINQIFDLPDTEIGLASVIAGETTLRAAIRDSGVVLGLSILPCGPRPANPAELLTSALFQDILDEIKKDYDFVLIDTPPLLAVSDPAVVATRVDGVLLTLRLVKNARPQAERAREMLSALGANVLGVVINAVEESKGQNYEYGYGYGYGYGEEMETRNGVHAGK